MKGLFSVALALLLVTSSTWSFVVKSRLHRPQLQRHGLESYRSCPLMALSDPSTVAEAITTASTTTRVFEPQFDSVGPMLLVISMCAISGAYWWNVVIPDRRQGDIHMISPFNTLSHP